MRELKDDMLTDAIKTALDYSYKVQRQKRAIIALVVLDIILVVTHFI